MFSEVRVFPLSSSLTITTAFLSGGTWGDWWIDLSGFEPCGTLPYAIHGHELHGKLAVDHGLGSLAGENLVIEGLGCH